MIVGRATMNATAASWLLSVKNGALEIVEGRRDRPFVAGRHQDQGPEEVVVDERELEHRQGRQGRPAERQDHPPVDRPERGAVDEGRLGQLPRDRLHVVAQHERDEAGLEDDVDEGDPEVRVVEHPVVAQRRGQREQQVDPIERHDDDLRGQQVAGREHHQQHQVQLEAEPREDEAEHRRDEQGQGDRGDRDDQRVDEVLRQLGGVPAVDEVVEGQVLAATTRSHRSPCRRYGRRAVNSDPGDREQPDQGQADQERVEHDPLPADAPAGLDRLGRSSGRCRRWSCRSPPASSGSGR